MPYPYNKMTQEDFDAIRRMTDPGRVWVGDAIATEYFHDEMPRLRDVSAGAVRRSTE